MRAMASGLGIAPRETWALALLLTVAPPPCIMRLKR